MGHFVWSQESGDPGDPVYITGSGSPVRSFFEKKSENRFDFRVLFDLFFATFPENGEDDLNSIDYPEPFRNKVELHFGRLEFDLLLGDVGSKTVLSLAPPKKYQCLGVKTLPGTPRVSVSSCRYPLTYIKYSRSIGGPGWHCIFSATWPKSSFCPM